MITDLLSLQTVLPSHILSPIEGKPACLHSFTSYDAVSFSREISCFWTVLNSYYHLKINQHEQSVELLNVIILIYDI